MAYSRTSLSGPVNFGADKKLFFYTTTADTLATIAAAGYINESTDSVRMENGDLMLAKDSNNNVGLLETINATGAGITFFIAPGFDNFNEVTTGGALSVYGTSFLNSTAAFTLHTAPIRMGHRKTIVSIVANPTLTTTGGGNLVGAATTNIVTFSAAYSSLDLIARSSTSWAVLGGSLIAIGGSATGEASVRTS